MLDTAIYGIGRWGQTLVRSVQGKSDRIRFTVGVARDIDKYRDFAAGQGLTLSADYAAVLADPQVQAVVIATANSLHAEHARQAARAGKHVFVEKPFGLERADAQAATRTCADAGVILAVGFNRRFLPAVRELKRMIDAGELGVVLHVEGQHSGVTGHRLAADNWRGSRGEAPGGGMTAKGIHVVDTMIHLCGAIDSVYATSERRVLSIEMDDTTAMLFRFRNGGSGYLGTIMATGDYFRVHVFGSKGWAELRGERTLATSDLQGKVETRTFDAVDIERAELEAFADAARGGAPFPVPPTEAVHGTAVLEAIVASVERGRAVAVA